LGATTAIQEAADLAAEISDLRGEIAALRAVIEQAVAAKLVADKRRKLPDLCA
jgi:hypothetical protein